MSRLLLAGFVLGSSVLLGGCGSRADGGAGTPGGQGAGLGALAGTEAAGGTAPVGTPTADATATPVDAAQAAHNTSGDYAVELNPADFVPRVDNPYFPLVPGSRWVYTAETDEGMEEIVVEVLPETRSVMGIDATVVRDTVSREGLLVEDTSDWYAQDKDGNVWYLGEEVKNYTDGQLSDTSGSWEAGVDGALPGVIMFADPRPGADYRQEYYAGEAEDMARVQARDGTAQVPFGEYTNLVVVEEWTPLEPGVVARKYYARGVGTVLEETLQGGTERVELVEFTAG